MYNGYFATLLRNAPGAMLKCALRYHALCLSVFGCVSVSVCLSVSPLHFCVLFLHAFMPSTQTGLASTSRSRQCWSHYGSDHSSRTSSLVQV